MDDKETEFSTKSIGSPTENSAQASIKGTETPPKVGKTTETGSEVNIQPESETFAEVVERLEALAEAPGAPTTSSIPESTGKKTPKLLKAKSKIVKAKSKIVKKSVAANGQKNITNKGKSVLRKKVSKAVLHGSKSGNNEDGANMQISSSKNQSDQSARGKENVTEPEKSKENLEKGDKSGTEKENQHDLVGNEEHTEKSPNKEKSGKSAKRRRRPKRGKKPGGSDMDIKNGENKDTDPETKKTDPPQKKEKTDGLIFMCSGKTKPDCFRYRIMGVSISKKDTVMGIKRGMKLFLYDFGLKLLYGVYKATSSGGVKLEPKAFGGAFPAQVRFEVHKDCLPLPEAVFKKAIKENYNDQNKFKTELTSPQVKKLMSLFRPADVHTSVVVAQDNKAAAEIQDKGSKKVEKEPLSRSAGEGVSRSRREEKDRDASRSGDSRTRRERDHDRRPHESRREASPRKNLFLSEKEYRTYGLRGEKRNLTPPRHLPPASEAYRRDYERERDRLLRHPIVLPRENVLSTREAYPSDRNYHHHAYGLGGRRDLPSLPASASTSDPYGSDSYYSRYYGSSTLDSYLPPPRREDIHSGSSLYSVGGRRESYLLDPDSLRSREDSDSLRRREDSDSLRRREIEHLDRLYSTYAPESLPSYQRTYHTSRLEASDLPASSRHRDAPSYLYR